MGHVVYEDDSLETEEEMKKEKVNILEIDFETYWRVIKGQADSSVYVSRYYEAVGLQVEGYRPGSITEYFRKEIPEGTEVVVGYHVEKYSTPDGTEFANAYGTALVRKK